MLKVISLGMLLFLCGCAKKSEPPPVHTEANPLETTVEIPSPVKETVPAVPAASAMPGTTLSGQEPVAASEELAMAKPTPENIQRALKNAGLYHGKIDGTVGPKTKRAIEAFQKENGLAIDGKVGPKTWEKLKTSLTVPEESQQAVPAVAVVKE